MLATALEAAAFGQPLKKTTIRRRDLQPDDVEVRVTHCGICHSDLHALRADPARGGTFPLVPGHEFVGEVAAVGSGVTRFAVGDAVAVGNIVDSCGTCRMCRASQENFCEKFPTLTYGGRDRVDGSLTQGAYSDRYVVRERFTYNRPEGLDPAAVAPLMCAGITVWEPLRSSGAGPGTRLGVAGLGGLGHLAVKLGRALGAEVTVFTASPGKADDAVSLGARRVVLSTDQQAMEGCRGSLDLVIDTVPAEHDLAPYLGALDLDGTLFSVGYLGPISLQTQDLLIRRKRISSAGSGGHRYTQDLLDFCGKHRIGADVEVVPASAVGEALDRLERNDVHYRFVLDLHDLADL